MMEDLYGDLEDPFFSLEDVANEEDQPPISNPELNSLKEQNTKLSSQNVALKMNISCLYKTAQLELERKESMISRLMKRIKRLEAEARNISVSQPSTKQECETNAEENHEICDCPTDGKREEPDKATLGQSQEQENDSVPQNVENRIEDQTSIVLNQSTNCSEIQHLEVKKKLPIHFLIKDTNQRVVLNRDSQRDSAETHRPVSRSRTASRDVKDRHRHSADSGLRHFSRSHSPSRPPHLSSSTLEYRRQQNKENVRVSRKSSELSDRDPKRRLRRISPANVHTSNFKEHIHRPISSVSRRGREDCSRSKHRSLSRESLMTRETELDKFCRRKRHRSISRSPHRHNHHHGEEYRETKRRKATHNDCRLQSNRSTMYDSIHYDRYSEQCSSTTGTHSLSPTAAADDVYPSDDHGSVSNSSKSRLHSVFGSTQDDGDDDVCSLMSDDSVGCSKFIFDVDELSCPPIPLSGDDYQPDDNDCLCLADGESSVSNQQCVSEMESLHDSLQDGRSDKEVAPEETHEKLQVDEELEELNEQSIDREDSSLVIGEKEGSSYKDEAMGSSEESDPEEGELTDSDNDDQQNPESDGTTKTECCTNIDHMVPPKETIENGDNGKKPQKSVHQRLGIRTNGQNRASRESKQRDKGHWREHKTSSSETERHSRWHTSYRHSREHSSNSSDRQSREHGSSSSRSHRSHGEYSPLRDQRTRPQLLQLPSEHIKSRRSHHHPSGGREHVPLHVHATSKCGAHDRTRSEGRSGRSTLRGHRSENCY